MKQGYKYAIQWIAFNDCPADNHDEEILKSFVSVCLVADLFGKTSEKVAKDVAKYRIQMNAFKNEVIK